MYLDTLSLSSIVVSCNYEFELLKDAQECENDRKVSRVDATFLHATTWLLINACKFIMYVHFSRFIVLNYINMFHFYVFKE